MCDSRDGNGLESIDVRVRATRAVCHQSDGATAPGPAGSATSSGTLLLAALFLDVLAFSAGIGPCPVGLLHPIGVIRFRSNRQLSNGLAARNSSDLVR